MTDLKPYFDRAKADSDEVARLQNEVDLRFNDGTDEGIQAAIDMQPALEAAIAAADASNKLYISMRNADQKTSNAASLFVSESGQSDEEANDKVMNRAAFFALSAAERQDFIKCGGDVTE